jgi:hypothetical protein
MSTTKADIGKRRERLDKLRNRHNQIGQMDFSEDDPKPPMKVTDDEGTGSPLGRLFSTDDPEQNKNPELFRIKQIIGYLTQQTPEEQMIPGTNVNGKNLDKLAKYLKGRMRTGSAPPWTKRAMDFLESSKDSETNDYESDKIRRFMGFLNSRLKKASGGGSKEGPQRRKKSKKPTDDVSSFQVVEKEKDVEQIIQSIKVRIGQIKTPMESLSVLVSKLSKQMGETEAVDSSRTSQGLTDKSSNQEVVTEEEDDLLFGDDDGEADAWFGDLLEK